MKFLLEVTLRYSVLRKKYGEDSEKKTLECCEAVIHQGQHFIPSCVNSKTKVLNLHSHTG